MDKLHSLFLFVGTFAIKVISGGAYCKGLFHVKIIYNLYSGWIYSSSTTLLKLHGELTTPLLFSYFYNTYTFHYTRD